MASATLPSSTAAEKVAMGSAVNTDWPLSAVLFSSACIAVGLLWDISWHRTIGRDTFWTLPHLLEQFGAVLAGMSCGWLVLFTTFKGSPELRARSVGFWGFRGPLGAWVTIWGTFVMITSAPFDDWWHNAYGLDVKIISPPHMVLALGIISIQLGAMLMLLAAQNRAADASGVRRSGWAFAVAGGILLTMVCALISEDASYGNAMHNTLFYQVTAGALVVFLVAFARSGRLTWPATAAAAIYMSIQLLMLWILQLFPATAKLAPIYVVMTHMIPPEFPLLLVIPALAVDLLLQRGGRRDWLLAPVVGVSFVALMALVHWFWGEFLLSPAAHNYFFGAGQWAYMVRPGPWQHQFWDVPTTADGSLSLPLLFRGLGIAALIGTVSARIGLWWGNGMSRVRR
jgi:hypothetical protein